MDVWVKFRASRFGTDSKRGAADISIMLQSNETKVVYVQLTTEDDLTDGVVTKVRGSCWRGASLGVVTIKFYQCSWLRDPCARTGAGVGVSNRAPSSTSLHSRQSPKASTNQPTNQLSVNHLYNVLCAVACCNGRVVDGIEHRL